VLAVAVVKPEPLPFKMPFSVVVTANVPEPVTGLPLTENPVGIDKPTLVTVPDPAGDDQDNVPEPSVVKTWLDVPSADGSVQVTLAETVPGDLNAT
jgi:hypothetical protein